MVEIGEWSIVVELPADVSDDSVAGVTREVTDGLRLWPAAAQKWLVAELEMPVRVWTQGP